MPLFNTDISTITPGDDYTEVKECDYKGEHFSVRDNGAIMRHINGRKRPNDEKWTFGTPNTKKYMTFAGEQVHRIVATAFHGEAPSPQHVVDHIDTNHCNNRPENLRWLTKLENTLLNEYTLAKVIYICGSVEAFLENPQLLYGHESEDANFAWMRAVKPEEAKATRENLKRLASRPQDVATRGAHVGDWIFKTHKDLQFTSGTPLVSDQTYYERSMLYDSEGNLIGPKPTREEKKLLQENNVSEYFETSNKLAQQIGWKPYTKPEFPCCPRKVPENPLQEYAKRLVEGTTFVVTTHGVSTVHKSIISEDQLLVVTKIIKGVKNFGLTRITWNGKVFIHESMGIYNEENGVMAAFTRAQGKKWDGPDSVDNYC